MERRDSLASDQVEGLDAGDVERDDGEMEIC